MHRQRRYKSVQAVALLGAVVALTVRCGSSNSTAGHACVPGASIACAGPSGCAGFQACNAQGTGYDPCECGDAAGSPGDATASSSGARGSSAGSSGSSGTDGSSSGTGASSGSGASSGASASSGSSGGSTSSSGAVVWTDSTGTPIGYIRQIGDGTVGANAFGESWEMIDPASGIVWNYNYPGLSSLTAFGTVNTGWTTSNCTGTEYVINPPPARFAVQLSGKSGYYAVPDAPTLTQVGLVSTMSGSTCTSTSVASLTFPASAMRSVTMPTAGPGTPPYHPGGSTSDVGAVVWTDSTGMPIGYIRQIGDGTVGANAFGESWEMIDPASGIVWNYNYPGLSSLTAFATVTTGWTTSNCTGTEYVVNPPPARFAVQLAGKSGYYAVPDAPTLTQVGLVSTMSGSTCTSTSVGTLTFPVTAMRTVTMPTAAPGTPPYHPGTISASGGTGSRAVVWKDSTGTPIGYIRQIGDGTVGANAFGESWEMIDPASGIVWNYSYPGLSSVTAFATVNTGWTTSNCTGTEYVINPPPARFAVQLAGKTGYYAVPDAPALTQVGLVSTMSGTTCTSTSAASLTFPVSAMRTVTMPTAPPGTPPYHPELQ